MEGVERIDARNILRLCPEKQLNSEYSQMEISRATREAFCYMPSLTGKSSIEDDIPKAVKIMHILTSDEAWGMGDIPFVDPSFKMKVRVFLRDLLSIVEPIDTLRKSPSVVHFLTANFYYLDDVNMIRVLRAYILAFPDTRGVSSIYLNDGDKTHYTALILAARDIRVPVEVLKTLLEGGVDVNCVNEEGDSALMVAVESLGTAQCSKVELLLMYGADICIYNMCMHNALHIAVYCMNVDGLRLLLNDRGRRLLRENSEGVGYLDGSSAMCLMQMEGPLDPDPLHLPDKQYNTPIGTVVYCPRVHYKDYKQVVEMLLAAGADADTDRDYANRVKMARISGGPAAVPRCFGMITSNFIGETFTIFAMVRKNGYSVDIIFTSDMVERFIDRECSVLPPPSMTAFDVLNMLVCCCNQRFEFDGNVDGIDIDIHFNVVGHSGRHTEVVSSADAGDFKLALRFPRGPCPLEVRETDERDLFSNIIIDKKYTVLHRAVLLKCPTQRKHVVRMTRVFCNPLNTCATGLTAVETLQQQFFGTVMDWEMTRLVSVLRADRDNMMFYVHKDAHLFRAGRTGTSAEQVEYAKVKTPGTKRTNKKKTMLLPSKKTREFINPFRLLPDDVCMKILQYVAM